MKYSTIIGLDNLNNYYDPSIKDFRLKETEIVKISNKLVFVKDNLADKELIEKIFTEYGPRVVVNLAVQAGVRNYISNPDSYIESNLIDFYNIPSTGLCFFTVYGPAGRPDMAYFGFTNKLIKGQIIEIFNYGNCKRNFTYVDDVVGGAPVNSHMQPS